MHVCSALNRLLHTHSNIHISLPSFSTLPGPLTSSLCAQQARAEHWRRKQERVIGNQKSWCIAYAYRTLPACFCCYGAPSWTGIKQTGREGAGGRGGGGFTDFLCDSPIPLTLLSTNRDTIKKAHYFPNKTRWQANTFLLMLAKLLWTLCPLT